MWKVTDNGCDGGAFIIWHLEYVSLKISFLFQRIR